MPTPIDAYSAYEDFSFCGEPYRVTMSFGTLALTLDPGTPKSKTCAFGMLRENDGVDWTDVYLRPGATQPATGIVRDMLRWSRRERQKYEDIRKYGYALERTSA